MEHPQKFAVKIVSRAHLQMLMKSLQLAVGIV
jgi:hypothetical protein